MNIRLRVYIIFFLSFSIYGQQMSVLKGNDEVTGYYQVPQEKVFVHYNSSLLFTGEHLYYKLYCFNDEKNSLTKISKIGYVALINEQGVSVFEHKIKLNKGIGQGDFFIPVSVPTGNYKVIGYTQWMLNVKNHFFQGDISILNPYQANQSQIEQDKNSNIPIAATQSKNEDYSEINRGQKISMEFDQKTYEKRSLVSCKIEDQFLGKESGTYSISIRKKDTFPKAVLNTAKSFTSAYNNKSKIERQKVSIGSSVFLPEMRGELIYGKIESNDSSYPVFNQHIGLSVPQNISDVHIVSTNKEGEFVFNLSERQSENNTLLIQVLEEDKDKYSIKMNDIPQVDYPAMNFYQFKVSSDLEDAIIKRSVYNQIENNFYSVKPDSILASTTKTPFYGKEIVTYHLDDYTRFETVKETVVEVVDGMWTTKDKNGNEVFGIRGLYSERLEDLGYLPLLLMDGIIEQDHGKIINSKAREIKSIKYIRDRYFLGSQVFEGIVAIETIDKDYAKTANSSVLSVELSNLQGRKKYFKQKYGGAISYDRIPDYRNQLLWEPNLEMKNKKVMIDFFTSDIPGVYEVSIEGFSNQGIPVSVKDSFIVQE